MKHVHFIPIIFVKMVITTDKKFRQSKTRLFKALVKSGAREYIITKLKAEKMPVNNTKHERQWLTDAGVIINNTNTATSFSFPELHANKLIKQSLHVVNLNINHYDMIIGNYLSICHGIDIHRADIIINWDDAAIPWRNKYSTTKDVFMILL